MYLWSKKKFKIFITTVQSLFVLFASIIIKTKYENKYITTWLTITYTMYKNTIIYKICLKELYIIYNYMIFPFVIPMNLFIINRAVGNVT